jgi:hypothetical protein
MPPRNKLLLPGGGAPSDNIRSWLPAALSGPGAQQVHSQVGPSSLCFAAAEIWHSRDFVVVLRHKRVKREVSKPGCVWLKIRPFCDVGHVCHLGHDVPSPTAVHPSRDGVRPKVGQTLVVRMGFLRQTGERTHRRFLLHNSSGLFRPILDALVVC